MKNLNKQTKMKKILFIFSLISSMFSYAQDQIYNVCAYEANKGIVDFTWECDTTQITGFIFSVGEYEGDRDGTGWIHKFVTLQDWNVQKYCNNGIFKTSTKYIIQNGSKVEAFTDLYDSYVNESGTLKKGVYVIGIIALDNDSTYNMENNIIMPIVGDNAHDDKNINIEKSTMKYLDSKDFNVYIKIHEKVFNVNGNQIQ